MQRLNVHMLAVFARHFQNRKYLELGRRKAKKFKGKSRPPKKRPAATKPNSTFRDFRRGLFVPCLSERRGRHFALGFGIRQFLLFWKAENSYRRISAFDFGKA